MILAIQHLFPYPIPLELKEKLPFCFISDHVNSSELITHNALSYKEKIKILSFLIDTETKYRIISCCFINYIQPPSLINKFSDIQELKKEIEANKEAPREASITHLADSLLTSLDNEDQNDNRNFILLCLLAHILPFKLKFPINLNICFRHALELCAELTPDFNANEAKNLNLINEILNEKN